MAQAILEPPRSGALAVGEVGGVEGASGGVSAAPTWSSVAFLSFSSRRSCFAFLEAAPARPAATFWGSFCLTGAALGPSAFGSSAFPGSGACGSTFVVTLFSSIIFIRDRALVSKLAVLYSGKHGCYRC